MPRTAAIILLLFIFGGAKAFHDGVLFRSVGTPLGRVSASTPLILMRWGLGCGLAPRSYPWGSVGRLRRAITPTVDLTPAKITQSPTEYKLTFNFPELVTRDDVHLSVKDRILTVEAQLSQENDNENRLGWIARSSYTEVVSRSFLLPEGVDASGISVEWGSGDGKAEVTFPMETEIITSETSKAGGNGEVDGEQPDRHANIGRSKESWSGSAEYLSNLSSTSMDKGKDATSKVAADADPSSSDGRINVEDNASLSGDEVVGSQQKQQREERRPPRSIMDAFDQEFEDLEKLMWGDASSPFGFPGRVFFPTKEEVAKRFKDAREKGAARVKAINRTSMAVNVSEKDDDTYLIRVDLPEGATRKDVKLTILPGQTLLKISFSPMTEVSSVGRFRFGGSKTVRLPRDADVTTITARFEAEDVKTEEAGVEDGVSAVEVMVSKAQRLDPIQINIL